MNLFERMQELAGVLVEATIPYKISGEKRLGTMGEVEFNITDNRSKIATVQTDEGDFVTRWNDTSGRTNFIRWARVHLDKKSDSDEDVISFGIADLLDNHGFHQLD